MPYISFNNKPANFNEDCDTCHNKILDTQSCFQCDICLMCFHPHCKSIVGAHIKRIAQQKTWECSTACKSKSFTLRPSILTPGNIHNLNQITSTNNSTKTPEAITLLQVHEFIKSSTENIMKRLLNIEESQNNFQHQFNDLNRQLQDLTVENKLLKEEITYLKHSNTLSQEIIYNLEAKTDIQIQEKISNNMLIAGIPNTNQQPSEIVNQVFEKLNVEPETLNEVEETSYLPSNPNRNPNSRLILIKFSTNKAKLHVQAKKRQQKTLTVQQLNLHNFENDNQNHDNLIYFRDQLSHFQLQLFREGKKLQKKHNIKYLWIKHKQIFMRKSEQSKVHSITSKKDLIIIDKHYSTIAENTEQQHQNNSLMDASFSSAI